MISYGQENERLEYKKTTGELKEAMNSIVSILNKHGSGTLIFGISPTGSVLGLQISDSTIPPSQIDIYNPGQFPPEYTPDDFANNDIEPKIRNELILKILFRSNDVESLGGGFKKVYSLCHDYDVTFAYQKKKDVRR